MSSLKPLILIFIFILISLPVRITKGCGPVDYIFRGYSFFNANLARNDKGNDKFDDFFLRFDDFYHSYAHADSVRNRTNLSEWNEIFCGQFEEAEIGQIIYGSEDNLRAIQRAADEKNPKMGLRLARNDFAAHLVSHRCKETIDYLIFAKQCEPHVTRNSNAWDPIKRETVAMTALIYEGERKFNKLKSNNLKLRYTYQLIRLAHYAGKYNKALEIYSKLLPQVDLPESIVYDWILAHRAGALKSLNRRVEAAYLFSLVFDRSEAKREAAFQSFSIRNEEEWQQCMLLCQSDHERATLHAMRASESHSKPADDMRAIYALDPQNTNLELLLAREIKKLEKDFLGTTFNRHRKDNAKYHKIPRKEATADLISLTQFVIQAAKEKKVTNPDLWRIAEGYLLYLSNDLYAADKVFAEVSGSLDNDKLQEQLKVFQLVSKITNYKEIDEKAEEELVAIIKDNKTYKAHPTFKRFMDDKLAYEYAQQGHAGKAFRMHYALEVLKPNPQSVIVEDLLAIALDPEQSKFDKVLTTNTDGTKIVNELLNIKGVMLWNEGNGAAALESFKQVPATLRGANRFNPFLEQAKPCVHCKQPDSLLIYNRPAILERIFELEFQANSDFSNGDKYMYELGVAHFNLSYFGPSWNAMDYFRSGRNWRYAKLDIFEHWYFPFGNKENHDLSKTKFYFEKALELTKDPERAARAIFWLARCDWHTFVTGEGNSYDYSHNRLANLPPEYRRYYRLLASDYADTDFYKWAIRECRYFEVYGLK